VPPATSTDGELGADFSGEGYTDLDRPGVTDPVSNPTTPATSTDDEHTGNLTEAETAVAPNGTVVNGTNYSYDLAGNITQESTAASGETIQETRICRPQQNGSFQSLGSAWLSG
jgi:hypothetical protein